MYFCTMRRNRFFILAGLGVMLTFVSCSGFNKLLKSTDNEQKYQAAMSYYEKKDYNRALQLFDVLQAAYRGKPEGEKMAYCTAESYYNMKDYEIASHYYKRYVVNYPFAKDAEGALFRSAYCYYLESPNISLDQTNSRTAISEFQNFIDLYPSSVLVDSANKMIDTLRYKLAEKDYKTCMLYYKMDEYQAAITSFEHFIKENPMTPHREEIMKYMVLTYYNYAENSVSEKQRERYELALEKYNTLSYMYPESKYISELETTIKKIQTELSNINNK